MRYEKIFDKKVEHNSIIYSLDSSVFLATSFTFLVQNPIEGMTQKKGNICGHTRGLCRILVLVDSPISMEIEKKV